MEPITVGWMQLPHEDLKDVAGVLRVKLRDFMLVVTALSLRNGSGRKYDCEYSMELFKHGGSYPKICW